MERQRLLSMGAAGDTGGRRSAPDAATAKDDIVLTLTEISDEERKSQLSLRAVLVGIGIGALLCLSNMFFGLQTGWFYHYMYMVVKDRCHHGARCGGAESNDIALATGFHRGRMGSLQSSILGFGVFRLIQKYSTESRRFTPLENVVLQTTAVACATMPLAGGFVGIIPALGMMTIDDRPGGAIHLSIGTQFLWCTALAFFGVFFAVPLRKETILREKLRFPSGTATAEMIAVLHHQRTGPADAPAEAARWQRKWRILGGTFAASAITAFLQQFVPVLRNIPFCDWFKLPSATALGWTITPSLSYVGQGMIMGPRTTLSMLGGAVVGWAILAPTAQSEGWADGPVSDGATGAKAWVTWVSLAVMLGEAAVTLSVLSYRLCRVLSRRFAGVCCFSQKPRSRIRKWEPLDVESPEAEKDGSSTGSSSDAISLQLMHDLATGTQEPASPVDVTSADGKNADSSVSSQDNDSAQGRLAPLEMHMNAGIRETNDVIVAAENGQGERGTGVIDENVSDRSRILVSGGDESGQWSATDAKAPQPSRDRSSSDEDEFAYDPAPANEQVPTIWWLGGLVASTALAVGVLAPIFDMPVYEPLVAVVLSLIVALLAVRALGETDLNPVSGVGKLAQVVFVGVAPGNILSNLIAGAVAEAGAQQAGDMMQDLKTGHLLRASPRAQFIAQIVGSAASILFTVLGYQLFSRAYTLGGPVLQVPTAKLWLDMAQLLQGQPLPPHVVTFGICAGVLAAVVALLHHFSEKCSQYLPSVMAFAIGMYITPNWVIARVVGGLVQFFWQRYRPRSHEESMLVVASGFVLGEGIMAVVNAGLKTAGVGPWTCAGCAVNMCDGCAES